MNVNQTQNEARSVCVYEDAPAAARRMPGSSVKNSQKAVPDPSQAGPPALGWLPGALAEGLATSHLATGTAKLAVPGLSPTLCSAEGVTL